jgi:hypothetical protein
MIENQDESSEEQEMASLELGIPQGDAVAQDGRSVISSKRRGRKKIQPRWCRVISFDDIDEYVAESHEIQVDLDQLESSPLEEARRRQNNWHLLFCPKEFWERLVN